MQFLCGVTNETRASDDSSGKERCFGVLVVRYSGYLILQMRYSHANIAMNQLTKFLFYFFFKNHCYQTKIILLEKFE